MTRGTGCAVSQPRPCSSIHAKSFDYRHHSALTMPHKRKGKWAAPPPQASSSRRFSFDWFSDMEDHLTDALAGADALSAAAGGGSPPQLPSPLLESLLLPSSTIGWTRSTLASTQSSWTLGAMTMRWEEGVTLLLLLPLLPPWVLQGLRPRTPLLYGCLPMPHTRRMVHAWALFCLARNLSGCWRQPPLLLLPTPMGLQGLASGTLTSIR